MKYTIELTEAQLLELDIAVRINVDCYESNEAQNKKVLRVARRIMNIVGAKRAEMEAR